MSRNSAVAAIAPLLLGAVMFAGAGCATRAQSQTATPVIATTPASAPATPLASRTVAAAPNPPLGAQPQLASDPAQLADDLVADERTLRDPATPDPALVAAAHREQAAYRAIARHPEWDAIARPRVPPELVNLYDRNLDARRQLQAMTPAKDTLPAWRVQPPVPADELISDYHAAEAETGVGWNYLAAINLIETRFGSINGVSTAGAQGPMQFLPSTFATYGQGGDINSPHDSIMAAGRFLAANGFANDPAHAVFGYNHAREYVRAVDQYAALIASDPATFPTYYRWDVYYVTTAGDVLLPVGYAEPSPIPVGDYLATHPQ
ncbi:transglycosylase SLT domain protein [Mycobacterium parascrofulaceum ATCC BAA-614]|uniref:Transglycosylase SLT domain protein n=2 Tax=Mycobacterium parascrofulaceum TaxID=240125 RepID=D5P884_9MYCO|nr:transglycosylase SLT domain protein [Mycobacterium parascrofulaceum ATCC BAA-614]